MSQSITEIRHERSQKDFPGLSLQDDEYVEFAFKRARVCLLAIIGGTFLALIVILLAFLLVLLSQSMIGEMERQFIFVLLGVLVATAALIAIFSLIVYRGNQLFVTNKRVVQKVMNSPVASSLNIIDLGSVEDVSFHKNGLLQTIFGYGTLRLATVGDETSYTFKYSDIRKSDLDAVQNLIASAKKHSHAKTVKESAPEDELEEPEKSENEPEESAEFKMPAKEAKESEESAKSAPTAEPEETKDSD